MDWIAIRLQRTPGIPLNDTYCLPIIITFLWESGRCGGQLSIISQRWNPKLYLLYTSPDSRGVYCSSFLCIYYIDVRIVARNSRVFVVHASERPNTKKIKYVINSRKWFGRDWSGSIWQYWLYPLTSERLFYYYESLRLYMWPEGECGRLTPGITVLRPITAASVNLFYLGGLSCVALRYTLPRY